MPDSLQAARHLLDTLIVKNITGQSYWPSEIIAPLAALLGVLFSGITSYLVQSALTKHQATRDIQKQFFSRKLDVYMKIPALIHKGYSDFSTKEGNYPLAYDSQKELDGWISDLEDFFNLNRMLFDKDTLANYVRLNEYTVNDSFALDELKLTPDKLDAATRKLGLKSHDKVNRLCLAVVESAQNYINKTYDI